MPIAIDGNGSIAGVDPGGVQSSGLVLSSSVATTSGTFIDINGIPGWVRRVTLLFANLSTNGSSIIQVQLGSGSIRTTGYISSGGLAGATNVAEGSGSVTGLVLPGASATLFRYGQMVISPIGGNSYVGSYSGGINVPGVNNYGASAGGAVTLSGGMDRLRLTTIGGVDTFDNGTVTILWE